MNSRAAILNFTYLGAPIGLRLMESAIFTAPIAAAELAARKWIGGTR